MNGANYRRNARNSFVPTKTIAVRADVNFWARLENAAKECGLSRNGLIVKILTEYMDGRGGK